MLRNGSLEKFDTFSEDLVEAVQLSQSRTEARVMLLRKCGSSLRSYHRSGVDLSRHDLQRTFASAGAWDLL